VKRKILVVEDDPAILTGLVDLLEGEGFAIQQATDGLQALACHAQARPDLVLLDVMIPEKSGFEVCRDIRRNDAATPIIMLTAKGEEIDKVVGLELGADDYVVKPFGAKELVARIRAVLRRGRGKPARRDEGPVSFGDVTVDPRTLRGCKGEKEFAVSQRELALLRLFAEREGEALDRIELMDEVWGVRYEGTTRTLDQHVALLRKKIEDDPSRPRYLTTVHGTGYRFNSTPS
jgi:DNA-binding response OmpR family regulator